MSARPAPIEEAPDLWGLLFPDSGKVEPINVFSSKEWAVMKAAQFEQKPTVVPLYSASALAAAEQRGREEEREKLARRYDDEAERLERASVETLSVADKMRLDASASQCRVLAAAIRRGTHGTAPPSSPPEQNGESPTPSHAPTPEGEG